MLFDKFKIMQRIIISSFSVSVVAILSGCVSASLDDIGLDNAALKSSNLVKPAAQTASNLPTNVSQPTALNAAVEAPASVEIRNAGEDLQTGKTLGTLEATSKTTSATALREDNLFLVPASNAITDFEAGSAPNRDAGIAQIRAKAAATGANAPNINEIPTGRGQHFTADELRLKKALLRAEAQAARGLITENELAQKRAQIAAMRRKAGTHYKQAVRQISN